MLLLLGSLKQFIGVSYEITLIEREETWEYPLTVLREALLNALTHRDYFNVANFIQIKVYDDHIWISNPGGLPGGITVEDLKRPHKSYKRNPLIARVFYLAGYVEEVGTGTIRMIEQMRAAGLPEPEFKEEMGGFSVYFYKDVYTEELLKRRGLNERQIRAVLYVKKAEKITNKEYQELNRVSRQTAARELTVLSSIHVLDRIGKTGKSTYYRLTATK